MFLLLLILFTYALVYVNIYASEQRPNCWRTVQNYCYVCSHSTFPGRWSLR